jgi:2-oxoglutarate ferredoxin oxidoreductase subunit gamma
MEETSIIISGFGGQGTLFAGQVLAYASMDNGLEVTWIPSYGPEMRGGTANCTVIVSEELIGSPLVRIPDVVLALNMPSVNKYENLLQDDGLLLANSSLFNQEIERKSIQSLLIPANDIASELGMDRLVNMIMVGAMLAMKPILPLDAVKKALEEHIPERHKKTLPINFDAMDRGFDFAKK